MRRATTIAAALAMLAVPATLGACDALDSSLDPSAGVRTDGSGTPGVSSTPPPPRTGRALVSIGGDARADLVFGVLTEPALYAGGEGPLSLAWRTASYDLLTLSGTVVLGSQPTSSSLRLQLAVELDREVVAFASDDGTCTVTVERAEPRSLAGEIACPDLTDADGGLTIEVAGTFEAGRDDA